METSRYIDLSEEVYCERSLELIKKQKTVNIRIEVTDTFRVVYRQTCPIKRENPTIYDEDQRFYLVTSFKQ